MSGLSLGNDWVVGTVKLMDGRSVSSVKNVDEKVGGGEVVVQGKSRNGEVFTEFQFLRQDQEVYPTFGALSDVNGTVGFSPDALERVARIEPRMNGLLFDLYLFLSRS